MSKYLYRRNVTFGIFLKVAEYGVNTECYAVDAVVERTVIQQKSESIVGPCKLTGDLVDV